MSGSAGAKPKSDMLSGLPSAFTVCSFFKFSWRRIRKSPRNILKNKRKKEKELNYMFFLAMSEIIGILNFWP